MKILEIICVICTVGILILIIVFLFLIWLRIRNINQAVAIAEKKCDKYAQLSCAQLTTTKKPFSKHLNAIRGGWNASEGKLPHMVFLQMTNATCSGSLISEYFVMTAAHCVYNVKKDEVNATLGSANRKNGIVFGIDRIYVHPKFRSGIGILYDIALLKLGSKVAFNWKTRPICLNTDFESISTTNMTVSGWGIDEKRVIPTLLRTVDTYLDGQILTRCMLRFGEQILSSMVCTGHPTEQKMACEGDFGGPLQIPLKKGCSDAYEQIGVTSSTTFKSCQVVDGQPVLTVYTKVEKMLPWIVETVWPY